MYEPVDDVLGSLAQHRINPEKLSQTVTEKLRTLIQNGTWPQGTRLPSEHQLAAALGVSRGTIRNAWSSLEAAGLIVARPGLGTFVSRYDGMVQNNLSFNSGLTEVIEQMGLRAGSQDLTVHLETADSKARAALGLPEAEPVVVIERVRTADDKPVALAVDIFARHLLDRPGHTLSLEDLESLLRTEMSVYRIFDRHLGRPIADGVATLKPVSATVALARRLNVPKGTALLFVEQVDHDRDHNAVLLSYEHHVPEICTFTVHRTR